MSAQPKSLIRCSFDSKGIEFQGETAEGGAFREVRFQSNFLHTFPDLSSDWTANSKMKEYKAEESRSIQFVRLSEEKADLAAMRGHLQVVIEACVSGGAASAAKASPESQAEVALQPMPDAPKIGNALGGGDATPDVWGPDLVFANAIEYDACWEGRTDPTCLRALGFSEQAIAFGHGLDGDYGGMSHGVEFRELGAVDLGIAEVIGASVWYVPVLLNGTPDFIQIGPTLDLGAVFADDASRKMLAQSPRAARGTW